ELGEAVDRAMDPYGGVASSRDLGEFVRREFGDMLERTRLLIEEAQARADRGDAARVVVPESQGGDPDVVIVEAPPAVVRRRSPLAGAALIAVAVAAVTGVVMWRPTGSAPPPAVVVY